MYGVAAIWIRARTGAVLGVLTSAVVVMKGRKTILF